MAGVVAATRAAVRAVGEVDPRTQHLPGRAQRRCGDDVENRIIRAGRRPSRRDRSAAGRLHPDLHRSPRGPSGNGTIDSGSRSSTRNWTVIPSGSTPVAWPVSGSTNAGDQYAERSPGSPHVPRTPSRLRRVERASIEGLPKKSCRCEAPKCPGCTIGSSGACLTNSQVAVQLPWPWRTRSLSIATAAAGPGRTVAARASASGRSTARSITGTRIRVRLAMRPEIPGKNV